MMRYEDLEKAQAERVAKDAAKEIKRAEKEVKKAEKEAEEAMKGKRKHIRKCKCPTAVCALEPKAKLSQIGKVSEPVCL